MIRLKNLIKKSLLKEDDIVKSKTSGNVYTVQQMDPDKHDKPTPDEIEKAKAASGGTLPKSGEKPTPQPKPQATPQSKPPMDKKSAAGEKPKAQPTQPQPGEAPPPGKLSGKDFQSSAEKNAEKKK